MSFAAVGVLIGDYLVDRKRRNHMPEKSHAATRGGPGGRAALGDGITISQLRAMVKGRVIAPGDASPPSRPATTQAIFSA
jgi:hypothetical protein